MRFPKRHSKELRPLADRRCHLFQFAQIMIRTPVILDSGGSKRLYQMVVSWPKVSMARAFVVGIGYGCGLSILFKDKQAISELYRQATKPGHLRLDLGLGPAAITAPRSSATNRRLHTHNLTSCSTDDLVRCKRARTVAIGNALESPQRFDPAGSLYSQAQ